MRKSGGRNAQGRVTVRHRGGGHKRYYRVVGFRRAKEGEYAHVRLPSGEVRLVRVDCKATIGQVSNLEHDSVTLGKAGRKRWLGVRPGVRGVAMDPASHPHGGGEGRSPIGMPGPVSPWGKPTLGAKTRKPKLSDQFIVKRRKCRGMGRSTKKGPFVDEDP